MNLKEDILKALEGKGYDDFAKIRWIYLYVCETFSYDTRFYYGNQEMKTNIYNIDIDITNVQQFEIICYTISRVLAGILNEMGYDAIVIRENNNLFSHAYVEVRHHDYVLKLDPTKRHDITRMKMNSTTIDFESLKKDDAFPDKLLETDKEIAQDFNGLYFSDKSVLKVIEKFLKELELEVKEKKLSKEEVFFRKVEMFFSMVNSRTDLKRYDDIDFYFSYVLRIFKINTREYYANGKMNLEEYRYLKPVVLFKKNDPKMQDIINISCIQYEKLPPIFYLLKKEGNSYVAREIFRDEAIELLKDYYCPFGPGQFLLEQAAQRLATDKKNGIIL